MKLHRIRTAVCSACMLAERVCETPGCVFEVMTRRGVGFGRARDLRRNPRPKVQRDPHRVETAKQDILRALEGGPLSLSAISQRVYGSPAHSQRVSRHLLKLGAYARPVRRGVWALVQAEAAE
jgi:hypothetical protein